MSVRDKSAPLSHLSVESTENNNVSIENGTDDQNMQKDGTIPISTFDMTLLQALSKKTKVLMFLKIVGAIPGSLRENITQYLWNFVIRSVFILIIIFGLLPLLMAAVTLDYKNQLPILLLVLELRFKVSPCGSH